MGETMIDFWRKGFGFEWILLPLCFVAVVHLCVWAICSFVAWDVSWISAFSHRLLFSFLCVFVWGALIHDHVDDELNKEKGEKP